MPTFAALLRAVNLPGHNKVSMAALADVCAGLGFTSVKTVLQSGNVVFHTAGSKASAARALSSGIEERFGIRPGLFLRSGAELRKAIDANPFRQAAQDDPSHLVLFFFEGKAGPLTWPGPERAAAGKGVLYIHYLNGIGRSKLTNAVIEKSIGKSGTGRNWNTVRKLAELSS